MKLSVRSKYLSTHNIKFFVKALILNSFVLDPLVISFVNPLLINKFKTT